MFSYLKRISIIFVAFLLSLTGLGCLSTKNASNDGKRKEEQPYNRFDISKNYIELTREWVSRVVKPQYLCNECDSIGVVFYECFLHELVSEIEETSLDDIRSSFSNSRFELTNESHENIKFNDTVYARCSCVDSSISDQYYVWFCTFILPSLKTKHRVDWPTLRYSLVIPFDSSVLYYKEISHP